MNVLESYEKKAKDRFAMAKIAGLVVDAEERRRAFFALPYEERKNKCSTCLGKGFYWTASFHDGVYRAGGGRCHLCEGTGKHE